MICKNIKDSFALFNDSMTELEILMQAMPPETLCTYKCNAPNHSYIIHHPIPIPPTSLFLSLLSLFSFPESQSHLPPSQPSLHLSFHNLQSNSPFPSFRLTSLCALHIHKPNSSRPRTRGSFSGLLIQS